MCGGKIMSKRAMASDNKYIEKKTKYNREEYGGQKEATALSYFRIPKRC